ncbi:MAG TPA: bifunctional DNA primase/polymerase [Candidatus Binataceae bacterium]|nr:bifunctional DNA primase/polymerase [Candidatus Binataceae bacterium]
MNSPISAPGPNLSGRKGGTNRAQELRDNAIRLVLCGFRVLRVHGVDGKVCTCSRRAECSTPGKHPIQKGWQKLATNDPDSVAALPWRNSDNIGAACGAGLGGLDLDRHRADANGFATLAEVETKYGPLPRAPRSHTGGGGLHIFFHYPPDAELHSIAIGPGLDFIGEGKMVVLPPSRHASGNLYRWEEGAAPWETSIPLMPQWLINQLALPPLPQFDPRLYEVGELGAYRPATAFLFEELLAAHHVPVSGPHQWKDHKLWLWRDQRARCPLGGDHDAGAFFLIQFRNGAVKAACFHHSCGSAINRWREFRARYLT